MSCARGTRGSPHLACLLGVQPPDPGQEGTSSPWTPLRLGALVGSVPVDSGWARWWARFRGASAPGGIDGSGGGLGPAVRQARLAVRGAIGGVGRVGRLWRCSSGAEQTAHNRCVAGSNPATATRLRRPLTGAGDRERFDRGYHRRTTENHSGMRGVQAPELHDQEEPAQQPGSAGDEEVLPELRHPSRPQGNSLSGAPGPLVHRQDVPAVRAL